MWLLFIELTRRARRSSAALVPDGGRSFREILSSSGTSGRRTIREAEDYASSSPG
jgi:hypothetical protein